MSCGCQLQLRLPGGFVWRRRGRRRHLVSPKRRHLLPLLFLGCLGCLGCPLASSATTPLAFRRRLDVVSTGFSAGRSIWTSRSRNYRHGSPGEARRRSARGVALRDAHDRPLAREGGQGIWLQARGAASCPPASRRSSGLRWPAESCCSMQQNRYKVRVILLTPQSQPPQGPRPVACGRAPRPMAAGPRRPRPPAGLRE